MTGGQSTPRFAGHEILIFFILTILLALVLIGYRFVVYDVDSEPERRPPA